MSLIFYIFLPILIYSGLSSLYLLIFSLASTRKPGKTIFIARSNSPDRFKSGLYLYNSIQKNLWQYKRIAVLIPAYKEDRVIVDTVKEAINMDYPESKYDVIVIADYLKADTLETLRLMPIKLIQVAIEKSTKSNALNYAMQQIGDDYDLAFVLDADNEVALDALRKLNSRMKSKKDVIQCHRVAKNVDTSMALLDAISEEINNNIFSIGQRNLGFSSRLAGSGMCFNYQHFKSVMKEVDAVGGFDKELEHRLLSDNVMIDYADDILIYDEKVRQPDIFARQRTRWIASQFYYLKRYFVPAVNALIKDGNFDFFNKAFQMALPPRLLFPPFLTLMTLVSVIIGERVLTEAFAVILIILITANFLAIPAKFFNRRFLGALIVLPNALIKLSLSLVTIKGKNKSFIHTPHLN